MNFPKIEKNLKNLGKFFGYAHKRIFPLGVKMTPGAATQVKIFYTKKGPVLINFGLGAWTQFSTNLSEIFCVDLK